MNDTLSKIHFWLTFIAFNCTFFPMHILGVGGHMRRISNPMQYEFLQGFEGMNIFITMSAFTLGTAQLILVFNFFWSMFRGKVAEKNPWQVNTLEWEAPTPVPHVATSAKFQLSTVVPMNIVSPAKRRIGFHRHNLNTPPRQAAIKWR